MYSPCYTTVILFALVQSGMVTILCIDDDPKMLQVQKAILGAKGYTVLTAPDGLTGIAVVRAYSIDVVITDFHMLPGMDGGQVVQLLMKEKPKLPVVIYSGCPEEIPERLKRGAAKFISKGDGPSSLLSVVEQLVAANATRKKRSARTKSNGDWRKEAS
jgi:DNA-binding NtrC family response regulator